MSIGSDLLRFSNRPIIVADGESQRVNTLCDNLPFEWSWIKSVNGNVVERHKHYLKWPNFKMSAAAAQITKFQQSWVDNGEDPRTVLEMWEKDALDENNLICGHNFLGFDVPLWMLWRRELGLKPCWGVCARVLDTHLLSRAYKMGWKPDRENLLAWQYKVMAGFQKGVKTNLTVMCKELGIPIDESKTHAGDYDVDLTAAVLWKLVNKMEI